MGRLFGTDGVRGVANKDLTCELAMKLGRAAAADRLEAALNACPVVITGQPDGATCAEYGDGILKLL